MKTVATFMHPADAHLLRIRLAGIEIPAVVCDDATASVMPHMANAIGGIRVQVADDHFCMAQEALREEQPLSANLREDFVCPNCGSSDVEQALNEKRSYLLSFLILFLVMLPLPLVKRRYQCKQCSHLCK